MTEDEADQIASERNRELARSGATDLYVVPVRGEDGVWRVEERNDDDKKGGWISRLLDAILPI